MPAYLGFAQEAYRTSNRARDLARACDEYLAPLLVRQARDFIALARTAIDATPQFDPSSPDSAERQVLDLQNADSLIRFAEGALEAADNYLRLCGAPTLPFDPAGGTFDGTRAGLPGTRSNLNETRFEFRSEASCSRICLVQVLHYRETEGHVVANPMSQGQARKAGDDPFADVLTGSPPLDADAAGGFVVDVNPKERCPCQEGSLTSQPVGGLDRPTNVRPGYEMYFEVVAVCLDTDPFTVLGSMRWRLVRDADDWFVSEILTNEGGIDWGRPTGSFERALGRWIKNRPLAPGTVRCR